MKTKIQPIPDMSTEQAILEAAEQLFLEKGFSLTSTTEIAKKAQCNQALVHYYYRTKENLFAAVFEKNVALFTSIFIQISNEDISFTEKLTRKIEFHFDMLKANPRLPFLLFNELSTNPKRLLAIKEKMKTMPFNVLQQLRTELAEEIKKGTICPIEPVDLIIMILSLNVGLFLAKPILEIAFDMSGKELTKLIDRKKKENVKIILNSLKP